MGLDVPHPEKDPLLGCLAGLWVGHHFLVWAGCGKTGHVGLKVPAFAGKETFQRRTEVGRVLPGAF